DQTAVRTSFARWEKTVSTDYGTSSKGGLVVELSTYFSESGVIDTFCHTSSLQSSKGQRFDAYQCVRLNEVSSDFVYLIRPNIGDSGMKSSELELGLVPVLTSFLSTMQFLTNSAHLGFVLTQRAWGGDTLSSGEYREIGDSEVDSNRYLAFAAMGVCPEGFV